MADLAAAPAHPPAAGAPRAARGVESRGIDVVPDAERRGKAWELFPVWFTGNLTFTYLLFGGILVQLGLPLGTAILLTVVFNAAWLLVGIVATVGPRTGTTTLVVSRAHYGIRGNRLSCLFNLVVAIGYEGINIAVASFAAFSLAEFVGLPLGPGAQAAVVLAIGAVVLTLGVYGHATIVRFQKVLAWALGAATLLFLAFLLPRVDWSYQPAEPLTGAALTAAVLVGISVVLSGALSYPISADYARYLPRSTSPRAVALFTASGGYVPAVLLTVTGVLAATVVDPTDFTTSLREVVPGWFYPVFLVIVVLGLTSNSIYSVYSAGLAMQSLGVPLRRTRTVWIDGGLGIAIALVGVLVAENFLTTLESLLLFSIYWLAPFFGIYLADLLISRGAYDGAELHDRRGRFWYDRGYRWPGIAALLLGMLTAAALSNTPYFQGPLSSALLADGDLSAIGGLLVGGAAYRLLCRRPHPVRSGAVR